MANNNRNQGNQSYGSDQDWNQNRERYNRQEDYNQNRSNFDDISNNRSYEDRNRGNYDQHTGYGNASDYRRHQGGQNEYEDRRNETYGEVYRGNVERREQETNRAQGGRYTNYQQMNRDQRGGNQDRPTGGTFNWDQNYDRDWNNVQRNYGDANRGRNEYGSSYGSGNYSGQGNRNYYDNNNRNREDNDWWDRTRNEVSSWFSDDDDRNRNSGNRVSGEHRGKGPRGYQRSKERIHEDICERLSEDGYLDASDIDVKVENTEVILSGTVSSRDQKRRAEDLTESVSGVRHVENRIRVNQGSTAAHTVSQVGSDVSRTSNSHTDKDKDISYTGTTDGLGNIGTESGTTNEIIRDTGNMNRNK